MSSVESSALESIVDSSRPFQDRERLRDGYRGVMLGLAVGNALGLPAEGKSERAIRRQWPQGITEIDSGERELPWDDDVAQAAILAELLTENPVFEPQSFADRLVAWARDNGRGIGNLTRLVVAELEAGSDPFEAARRAGEREPMSGAGNGAVMRCPPIALRYLRSGVDQVRTARMSALVTHHDPRCEWSTVATTVALGTCLSDEPVALDQLADGLAAVGGEGPLADAIQQVVEAIRATAESSLKDLGLDDPMDMGFTLKTMNVALWCATQESDFERILIAVVNAGGDTDTNGALAGAVMGARCGASSIPERWLEAIHEREKLTNLADELLEASEGPS